MWRDFEGLPFDIRFPPLQIAARIAGGRDPIMEPSSDLTDATGNEAEADRPHPRASAWLWRPWYAKAWWAAIAAYWAGKVASLYSASLDQFYTTALAGFLNVAFFPPLALMVLGLGFVQSWLDRRSFGRADDPIDFDVIQSEVFGDEWNDRRLGHPHPSVDIYDPRSGPLFIGNPQSLQHPGRH